ncbi:hypothetical protein B0A50_04041 [Salinomyces thailandicus]|uniref:Uncharacterized protein n=1 Tax=Salinomyces thailandicus TaxID=706561 RepID=A0A4U0U1J3_9PEZI|nr:hypothetical protein B0A50_04041 [Salinomyces thailandica]
MVFFCGLHVHLPVRKCLRRIKRAVTGRDWPVNKLVNELYTDECVADQEYAPDRIYLSFRSDHA